MSLFFHFYHNNAKDRKLVTKNVKISLTSVLVLFPGMLVANSHMELINY